MYGIANGNINEKAGFSSLDAIEPTATEIRVPQERLPIDPIQRHSRTGMTNSGKVKTIATQL